MQVSECSVLAELKWSHVRQHEEFTASHSSSQYSSVHFNQLPLHSLLKRLFKYQKIFISVLVLQEHTFLDMYAEFAVRFSLSAIINLEKNPNCGCLLICSLAWQHTLSLSHRVSCWYWSKKTSTVFD